MAYFQYGQSMELVMDVTKNCLKTSSAQFVIVECSQNRSLTLQSFPEKAFDIKVKYIALRICTRGSRFPISGHATETRQRL